MALTTDNIKYSSTVTVTCTMLSLLSSATVGRQCTPVDNSSNLYDDALLTVSVTTSSGTLANDKAVYIYIFGSEDGTNYDNDDAAIGAADTGYTVNTASNLKGPGVISCPTASIKYYKTFSVASFFGGILPKSWGYVCVNFTGQRLGASYSSYTGITYTNQ